MASDNSHAQILEALGNTHEKRVVQALSELEKRIASLIGKAPLKNGNLFDLEWAIAARRDILQVMTEEYLTTANVNVKEYKKALESAEKMISKYTDFVGLSPEVVRGLQNVAFRGYEDIANTFVNDLANELYNNTLTGRSVDKSITTMRQKINGVYAQSDQVEIERLVNIANAGGAGAADAIKTLHSIYAADKLGNNMRRYASQMVHDALMQFDAAVNVQSGRQTGATQWKYYGSVVNDTRPFCEKHAGKVYTEEQIAEIWAGDWAGKAAGDPFIVRGGYNCRHHWRPYYSETEGEIKPEKPKAPVNEKPSFVIPDEVAVTGSKDAFIKEMNKLSDDQIKLVNKLPKPSTLEDKVGGGTYYPISKRLEAESGKRSGSIVRHEYGHHVDYMLGKDLQAISETDAIFLKAYETDRKTLGLHRNPTKSVAMDDFYSFLYEKKEVETVGGFKRMKSVIKNDELGNFSDIVDALTAGDFYSSRYAFGHGKTYYKRSGSKQKEIFANLFALRNTEFWDVAKQKFPELTKRFDEIIAEGLK